MGSGGRVGPGRGGREMVSCTRFLRIVVGSGEADQALRGSQTSSLGLDLFLVSQFRRCSRPGCGKPAVATLTYAYADSTAVVGPLAPAAEPHSWDLCEAHASKITAPLGWEMLRVSAIEIDGEDDEDLTALAAAVREAGRVTSGLVDDHTPAGADPLDAPAGERDAADPDSSPHPVFRTKRVAEENRARRAHLRVVSDEEIPTEDEHVGRHRREP